MSVTVGWLTRPRPVGVTWGVPWPRGTVPSGTPFGAQVPLQSWVTATWPDGSVKWSAHAVSTVDPEHVTLVPGDEPAAPARPVRVVEDTDAVVVDTGVVRWTVPRRGPVLISGADRDGRQIVGGVRLTSLWQNGSTEDGPGVVERHELTGQTLDVTVEQSGPVRAVVRIEGRHRPGDSTRYLLRFTVRLYAYAGADDLRIVHSVVWDGDPEHDFLAGLGLHADVPMPDEPHDRHIRLAGPTGSPPVGGDRHRPGFLTEAVRGITGLRRDPGAGFRDAQIAGRPCGPVDDWDDTVSRRVRWIPLWNDWTLDQNSADGFLLRKRTGPGRAWVTIPSSTRAAGYGYVGGVTGGLGFGLRDFARLHPTRLDIRNAATDTATASVWLWSPSAPAMDLRYWHDGLGQETYADQLDALEITYEDYEPGFGDAHGIARTHELVLRAHDATPAGDDLAAHAAALDDPPLLVAPPEWIRAAGVFGDWAPADRSTPERTEIEDRLDFLVDFFATQREQRRWYGFWDYGDVMHAYDRDRHQWRYDIGGYAWDNSELSTDLWLWYQFLRTGRADVYRLAEAMTRHTGEVDVYHVGPWAGLGTRHNVQHWGCSAKQLRISSAVYRRIFYYLTADERVGDLLSALGDAERTFLAIDPLRKVRTDAVDSSPREATGTPDRHAVGVGLGTDWSALAATWLTVWERAGNEPSGQRARDKLLGTMRDIGDLPHGFFTGEALLDLHTGRFDSTRDRVSISHLSAVFGLVEVCAEVIALTRGTDLAVPAFERAWLDYCRLYLASPEEQRAFFGTHVSGISLIQAHSRLAAYASATTGDGSLAELAWRTFRHDKGDQLNTNPLQRQPVWHLTRITGPTVLAPVDEAAYLSTNDAAQYGLAAIQNLALLGDPPPKLGDDQA